MRQKLRAALLALNWQPATQVKRAGDYYIATVNIRGRPRRGISTSIAEAMERALLGSKNKFKLARPAQ